MAVVLRDAVGASRVDAARHAPVLSLEAGEPEQKRPGRPGVPEAQERLRRERAVADPGAGVRARPGLDRRAVAIDEDPGELGLQDLHEPLRLGRNVEDDAVEAAPPPVPLLREERLEEGRGVAGGEAWPGLRPEGRNQLRRNVCAVEGNRDDDLAGAGGRKLEVERERPRGEARRVVHGARTAAALRRGESPRRPRSRTPSPRPRTAPRAGRRAACRSRRPARSRTRATGSRRRPPACRGTATAGSPGEAGWPGRDGPASPRSSGSRRDSAPGAPTIRADRPRARSSRARPPSPPTSPTGSAGRRPRARGASSRRPR